jgi:hypothetical protein
LPVTIRDKEVPSFCTGTGIHREVREREILFRDQANHDKNYQGGKGRVPEKLWPWLPS